MRLLFYCFVVGFVFECLSPSKYNQELEKTFVSVQENKNSEHTSEFFNPTR